MTDEEESNGNGQAAEGPQAEAVKSVAEELDALQRDKQELHDRLLRTAAEFENFKKRSKKELDESATRGREQLLKELLPVFDNLERALQHAPAGDPLAVGVEQTQKLLLSALEKFGVQRFTSVGEPFDPTVHDAIQQVETDAHAPGAVAQEFAAGYRIGQRLLRPAMVAVAKAKSAPAEKETDAQ